MSFLLVLAALATLVAGLIQTGLVLVWVSIGCSVLAGLVLTASVLRGRPSSAPAASGARSFGPTSDGSGETPAPAYASASAPSSSSWSTPVMGPEPSAPDTGTRSWERPAAATPKTDGAAAVISTPEPAGVPEPALALLGRLRRRGGQAPTPSADVPDEAAAAGEGEPEAEEVEEVSTTEVMVGDGIAAPGSGGFPIDDYEKRRATDVISRLDSLSRSELAMVREREASTKNRFSVMSRIDARIEVLGGPDVGVDDGADVDAADLPIADYDSLRVGQILPALSDLGRDALAVVRRHEATGRARSTVLDRIDRLAADAPAPAIAMPAAAPAPASRARKGAPRKAAPRKATARKAASRKSAAPRKAATRKAAVPRKTTVSSAPAGETTPTATKAPAKRAPAKKAAAKKAAVKKSPAKKSPAKKTVAKKTVAKKTPTKKAVAKKAVAKRPAGAVKKAE